LISGISSWREYFWVITGFITKIWLYLLKGKCAFGPFQVYFGD
jgi:hypothetical protein